MTFNNSPDFDYRHSVKDSLIANNVNNNLKKNLPKIAVIGAGIAGMVAANRLQEVAKIVVFDKARGVGGRMASRIVNHQESNSEFCFDFGAQFFNAKSQEFKKFLQPFIEEGLIAKWRAKFVEIDGNKVVWSRNWEGDPEHYVVMPKMTALCKKLAQGLDIRPSHKITKIVQNGSSSKIFDEQGNDLGEFDFVIVAIPPKQAAEILPSDFKFRKELSDKKMVGCFAIMLGLEEEFAVDWDVAYLKNSKLSWIAKEGSKPHRKGSNALTILSRNAWAENNLHRDPDSVRQELLEELFYATGKKLPKVLHSDIHRWLYANIGKQEGEKFFFDEKTKIALCGDWFIRGRIEAAFISASLLAKNLHEFLSRN